MSVATTRPVRSIGLTGTLACPPTVRSYQDSAPSQRACGADWRSTYDVRHRTPATLTARGLSPRSSEGDPIDTGTDIEGVWIDATSFFAEVLPARLLVTPCSLIDIHYYSWREVGDTYGIPTLDETLHAIKRGIARAVPPGTVLTQPWMDHFLAAVDCDSETAVNLAISVVETLNGSAVETTQGPMRVSLAAGVASSAECPSAAHLAYVALTGAYRAPHHRRRVSPFPIVNRVLEKAGNADD